MSVPTFGPHETGEVRVSLVVAQVGSLVAGKFASLLCLSLQLSSALVQLLDLALQPVQLPLSLADLLLQLSQLVGTQLLLPLQVRLCSVQTEGSSVTCYPF